ncbi:MAG: hypothetical protein ACI4HL_01385 [Ruminococcus sp.]
MKLSKVVSVLLSIVFVLSLASLAGCGDDQSATTPQGNYVSDGEDVSVNNNVAQATTVSQPSVDENSFPENFEEIENEVYLAIASRKRTEDGKTTGSDTLKILAENDNQMTSDVEKKVKKEVISAVESQVEEVEITNVELGTAEGDSTMGLMTVTFKYKETGGVDKKIYNIPLS